MTSPIIANTIVAKEPPNKPEIDLNSNNISKVGAKAQAIVPNEKPI